MTGVNMLMRPLVVSTSAYKYTYMSATMCKRVQEGDHIKEHSTWAVGNVVPFGVHQLENVKKSPLRRQDWRLPQCRPLVCSLEYLPWTHAACK